MPPQGGSLNDENVVVASWPNTQARRVVALAHRRVDSRWISNPPYGVDARFTRVLDGFARRDIARLTVGECAHPYDFCDREPHGSAPRTGSIRPKAHPNHLPPDG